MSWSAISHLAQGREVEDVPEQVLREDDAAGADEGDPRHPLFAPSVSPLTKCFWRTTNTRSVGSAVISAPAASRLLSVKNSPWRLLQRRRDRVLAAGRDQDQGPEELVVDERELERRERRERRHAERQDDLEVLPHDACPVHPGRLAQRLRDRLHVVGEHEGAEARLERHVDRDQPDVRVVEDTAVREPVRQGQPEVEAIQRLQDHLLRQKVRRHEEDEQGDGEPVAEAGDDERDRGREEQDQEDRRDRDDHRVPEVVEHVATACRRS